LHDPKFDRAHRVREKLVELEQIVKCPQITAISICIYRAKPRDTHHPRRKGKIDVRTNRRWCACTANVSLERFGHADAIAEINCTRRFAKSRGRQRGFGLHAPGRTRNGLAAKIHALQITGGGPGYRGGKRQLGYPRDLRDLGGAQILVDLGVRQFVFFYKNPKKVVGLRVTALK
jgi:hypothetical protein